MTLASTVNGAAITQKIAPSGINITHRADGDPSQGGLPIEDPAAALTMVGWKTVTVEESECAQPRLFTGFTMQRDIGRSLDEGLFVGEDARLQDLTVTDLNAVFGFRVITGADGNRPAETWAARLTWILESAYLSEFLSANQTWVVTNTTSMEETDYRGSYAANVMEDLVDRSGGAYIYFAFYDTTAHEIRLFFDNDTESLGLSTISISNDWDDVDNDYVFAPDSVAKLARECDQVYSDVVVTYNKGTQKVYRYRPTTAAAYVRRGTEIQRPYTKGLATATDQADKWLTKHSVETDRITCSIQVPANRVGLVEAGQSITVRFTHLPGYETATVMRVVSYSPRPTNDVADYYNVALELVGSVTPITEGAYAILTWAGSDVTGYYAGYVNPPWRAAYQHNGNFPHMGDAFEYCVPISGPLQYVNADGSTPAPGPYTAGDFSDRARGIKCLADGVVDVRFALTGIQVFMVSFTINIYLNGASVASQVVTGGAPDYGQGIVYKNGLVVASGDVIEGWMSAEVGAAEDYVHVPSGVGSAAREHLKVTGIMGGSGGADVVVPLPPTPGSTTEHTVDPTVTDDAAAGYTVGSTWINTTTGDVFILVDSTTGAAVWIEISSPGVTDHGALTGLADDDHTQYVLKRYGGKEVVSTVAATGATETIDLANGNVFDETLTADCTFTFAGATNGVACSFTLLLRQDGTGGWTTTWPGSVVWAGGTAPTLDETASTLAVLTFFTLDGGTVWYGFPTSGGGVAGGTPALTFGTTNAEGVATTAVLTDATLAIFDATVPTTAAAGDAGATGSAAFAARRDHRHGMPAFAGELLVADSPLPVPRGTFSTTAHQTVASTTTAYAVALATDDLKIGLTHSTVTNNSRIYIDQAGTYSIIVSAIADDTAADKTHLALWLAVDGANVANSTTVVEIATKETEVVVAVAFAYDFTAGQYFELMYRGDATTTRFIQTAAGSSPTRPASPAVIVAVNMEAPAYGLLTNGPTPLLTEAQDDYLYAG